MTMYLAEGGYLRAIAGPGQDVPRAALPDGTTFDATKYVFTGETLVEQPSGAPQPTYNFAGFAFATPSGAPYTTATRTMGSALPATGTLGDPKTYLYYNKPVELTYSLADGTLYYHRVYTYQTTYTGAVNGNVATVATETVDGSFFNNSFYKSRIDTYNPAGSLIKQVYKDAGGVDLLASEYTYASTGPWAKLVTDYEAVTGFSRPAHQVYSAADGTVYANLVFKPISGGREIYTTGSGVTDSGFSARIDQYQDLNNQLTQQRFLGPGDVTQLTIDYTYSGLFSATSVSTGTVVQGQGFTKITNYFNLNGPGFAKRVYDLLDGSHTTEVTLAGQSLFSTKLGAGVTNADDNVRLFGSSDLFYASGRFGHDTLYNFQLSGGSGLPTRISFDDDQFADLAAVRAAATATDNGHDITITNTFGDTLVLKQVLDGGHTINDVLNSNTVIFLHPSAFGTPEPVVDDPSASAMSLVSVSPDHGDPFLI